MILEDGMSYREIAECTGMSMELVRRIEKVALRKLAHPLNRARWRSIMDTLGAMEEERARAIVCKEFEGGLND